MSDIERDHVWRLYQRHAALWAQLREGWAGEKPYIDDLLDRLTPGARVLDLGCGAGAPIAAHVIARYFQLTGVDAAAAQIERCKARWPSARWICADMRKLALGSFDALIAWDSFFHLPKRDQRAMFPIFAAHLAPGGFLLFTSGDEEREALSEFGGETLFHDSLSGPEYRVLLDAHGFDLVRNVASDPKCGDHTVWLAQLRT